MSSCEAMFYTTIVVLGSPILIAESIERRNRRSINDRRNRIDSAISFDSLPAEVREFWYRAYKDMTNAEWGELLRVSGGLLTFNTAYEYQLECARIRHYWSCDVNLLIDKTNNITFTLELPRRPITIYDRYVFIPIAFFTPSMGGWDGFNNWVFNKYSLDRARQTPIKEQQ